MTCHIFIHVHYLRTRIKAGIRKSTKYYSGTCRYFEELEEISFNKKNLKNPSLQTFGNELREPRWFRNVNEKK